MIDDVEVESILQEMLDMLRRHHISIETVAVDVSLLNTAFDELIPPKDAKGHYHRSMLIDNVPMLFHVQRRHPFDEIVQVLEYKIRPPIEDFANVLSHEYPYLKIEFASSDATGPTSRGTRAYGVIVKCQFSDDMHEDYNILDLTVALQQSEPTEYPKLTAWVGWLIDEESGNDWGLDIKYESTLRNLDYSPHHSDMLLRSLPEYFKRFRDEIAEKQAGRYS